MEDTESPITMNRKDARFFRKLAFDLDQTIKKTMSDVVQLFKKNKLYLDLKLEAKK